MRRSGQDGGGAPDLCPGVHHKPHHTRKKGDVCFHDTVVRFTPNGSVSSLQPPVLHTDRESSTTLSSIWDIEVEVDQPGPAPHTQSPQTKETKKEKRAPLVHFRRSHVHLATTHHPRFCPTKARDNSSCEISICEINSCHHPRPGTSEDLTPTHGKDKQESPDEVKVVKSSKLPAQHSVESTDSFTTTDTQGKQESSSSQVPVATALFVATCLGTPAIALTGLKLGMFAAVGGGIMGFATGKMFAEHEEKQALAKGEFSNGDIPAHIKRKKRIKRIHEWEKFETNCQILRELDDDKICKISDMQRQRRTVSVGNLNKEFRSKEQRSNLRKAKSVSYSHQLSP